MTEIEQQLIQSLRAVEEEREALRKMFREVVSLCNQIGSEYEKLRQDNIHLAERLKEAETSFQQLSSILKP